MSWAQIRMAINTNLERALDVLINDRANAIDTNIAAINNRVVSIDTRTGTIQSLANKQEAVVSNNMRFRVNTNVLLASNNNSHAIARVRTRVAGRYRVIVSFARTNVTIQPGTRMLLASGGGVNANISASGWLPDNAAIPNLVLDFDAPAGATFGIQISRGQAATAAEAFIVTRMDFCYDLVNVNNHAVVTAL